MKSTLALTLASLMVTSLLTGCGGGGSSPAVSTASTLTTGAKNSQPEVLSSSRNPVNSSSGLSRSAVTQAYEELNTQRTACGFSPLNISGALENASANHAAYLLQNQTTGHEELAGKPYYTGSTAAERAVNSQYLTSTTLGSVAEELVIQNNQAAGDTPVRAVRTLLSAPYHMLGMLDNMEDMGGSLTTNSTGSRSIFNLYVGRRSSRTGTYNPSAAILTYPCARSTHVATHIASEYPDPLRNLKGSESLSLNSSTAIGQPVMVRTPEGTRLTIHRVIVKDALQHEVATHTPLTQATDATGNVMPNEAVIMPKSPLAPQQTYYVQIIVSYVHLATGISQDRLLDFSFTTGTNNENLF